MLQIGFARHSLPPLKNSIYGKRGKLANKPGM
jgi:hypothetical protein